MTSAVVMPPQCKAETRTEPKKLAGESDIAFIRYLELPLERVGGGGVLFSTFRQLSKEGGWGNGFCFVFVAFLILSLV
ncbi:hypothetical protein CEXT_411431 [Caerostris extrusa]|uniref:Uncharacterized protein n=1 Tax=Caerostris extrusa TaxID=172846 RepID=A0AAV4QVQ4_CAEEX|nr:hypothetical protein CEXT_411431 [Caerostris extrusa]